MITTNLSPGQVEKSVYDPATNSWKVKVVDSIAYDSGTDSIKVEITGGSVSVGDLDVITSVVVDSASIPNNAGSPFEVVTALSANVKKIIVQEQTGARLQLRTGAAVGTLKFYIAPGQDTPVEALISSGTRVSIRSDEALAPASGQVILTFLG